MKRTTPLKRKARLVAKGGSRFPKSVNRKYRAWIREQKCVIYELWVGTCHGYEERYAVEPAHVKPWGSSGKDEGNLVPLCPYHHDEQEGKTRKFEARYGVNLTDLAAQYWARYQQEQA